MSISGKLYHFFNKPYIALLIIVFFIIGYIILTIYLGGYGNKFLSFGPTKDKDDNYTKFIGLELDTWNKIIIVYSIIFFSNFLQNYYKNVIKYNISFANSSQIQNVSYSKSLTYFIIMVDPFINIIFHIINFFASATFQLQFIIPQFVSSYLVNLPFLLHNLSKKIYAI